MKEFRGLSAFPITPAHANGEVRTDHFSSILSRLVDADVNSIGLLGSTGGYAYLTRKQRRVALEAAAECVSGKIPLIASVGSIRTDEACVLAKDAAEVGMDGLLMAPVSYTPLTQGEAFQHYRTVSEATDLPLCIYNNPGTTHFVFEVELLERLSKLPNIAAVKMPLPGDGDHASELERIRSGTEKNFSIGYSGDWGCAAGMLAGSDAWYSVVGGIFPEQTMKLATACASGDHEEASQVEEYFQPMWGLFREYGSLRVVYKIAEQLALTDAKPHLPLMPVPPEITQRIIDAIERLNELD